ncbi:MAG: TonB-dependent receptor [Saprospiraceae bacterium]
MKILNTSIVIIFLAFTRIGAQVDTISYSKILEDIIVRAYNQSMTIKSLPDIHGTYIIGGRKSEVVEISSAPLNLAEKTGRQLFAKIPGAFIYDMDGSGNQINVATRGLDPHRSWEFNIRQNGVIINSDIYGYPASHYSMPMEAVQKIELVRGTAALQYGAEFGGMINYVLKSADTTQAISVESIHSAGSYGLLSSYNSIGGRYGKWTYFGYYQKRVSEGYRKNSRSNADAQFFSLKYDFSNKFNASFEIGRSNYTYQIPGALTDKMFADDPRQSTRSRNYFNPEIYVPSLQLNYEISPNTRLNWVFSGVLGERRSVLFEGFADKPDEINPATNQYAHRVVDIDRFNSKTTELRLLHHYSIGNTKNILTVGVRYFNNDMRRRQKGKGSTSSEIDFTIEGSFGRDLNYLSNSVAISVENMVYLTQNFTVSPGFRYELGKTNMTGYISYLDPKDIPNLISHKIPALGLNMNYKINASNRLYGGFSQAYRPVLFKDIIPGSTLERANKDLKDALGYNVELGWKGTLNSYLKFEITAFDLKYNHKLGNLINTADDGSSYIFKTNIGDSRTIGLEAYGELSVINSNIKSLNFFTSTSWMKGEYTNATLAIGNENININGNQIESVPSWISRNGVNFAYKGIKTALQYSYVSESYSDQLNTETPSENGAIGLVPAYGIWDFNAVFSYKSTYTFRFGINNLLNHQYFTKRPLFYPGPGIWSSDGRSIVISMGVKI